MDSAENEYQTLRAVDPGAGVEGARALPQPGDLGVPPFVRRQRGVAEGEARDYREAEREQADDWGPPLPELDARTLLLAIVGLAVALAVAIKVSGLALGPDRFLLVLLVPALILRRGRVYLRDFFPFAVMLVVYAQCRGMAHLLNRHPFYWPQIHADQLLFFGHVPSVDLQSWLWTGTKHWYDSIIFAVMRTHFIVPPLFAFALWLRRRALFYRFAATMITLSMAGAFTFLLFPAAPPWAAANRAMLQAGRLPIPGGNIGSHTVGIGHYSISRLITGNPYAAIPSLHAGYAFLVFLFAVTILWKTRWRWFALVLGSLYPLAQSFAVVYTGTTTWSTCCSDTSTPRWRSSVCAPSGAGAAGPSRTARAHRYAQPRARAALAGGGQGDRHR